MLHNGIRIEGVQRSMTIKATTTMDRSTVQSRCPQLITMASKTLRNLKVLSSLLLIVAVSALPRPDSTEDVATDPIIDDDVTLATDLQPPPKPTKNRDLVFFVVNVYGVKNSSDDSSEATLDTDLVEKVPRLTDSLATVFMVIELDDGDEETDDPVDLDDLASALETEKGFNVEKMEHSGETRMLKVKVDRNDYRGIGSTKSKLEKITKGRNKRSPCFDCKLSFKAL